MGRALFGLFAVVLLMAEGIDRAVLERNMGALKPRPATALQALLATPLPPPPVPPPPPPPGMFPADFGSFP